MIGVKPAPDNEGIINAWTNKSIGVFLTVKAKALDNGNMGYEFNIRGFYDPNTKLTAKEKVGKPTTRNLQEDERKICQR